MSLPTIYDAAVHAKITLAAEAVWELINSAKCVAWIGSGLSLPYYPTWDRAVEKLCEECLPPDHPWVKTGANGLDPKGLLELSDLCKEFNPIQYHNTLGNLYGSTPTSLRPAYSYLGNIQLECRLTTNCDPSLKAAAGRGVAVKKYPDLLSAKDVNTRTIFYMHGIAQSDDLKPDGSNIIFCSKDMDKAYERGFLRTFIESVLPAYDMLFIGCRLGEYQIDNIFRRLQVIYEEYPKIRQRKHRILAADGDDTVRLETLGIQPIRYPKINDAYEGLDKVLERVDQMQRVVLTHERDLAEERPSL